MPAQRVVIIGAANGYARPLAEALGAAGMDVAIAAASMDGDEVMNAKRAAKMVQQAGRKSFSQAWDVTLPVNIQVSFRQLVKELGNFDALIYNVSGSLNKQIAKVTDAEATRAFELGLLGAYFATRTFLRELEDPQVPHLVYLADGGSAGVGGSAELVAAAGLSGLAEAVHRERPDAVAAAIPIRNATGGYVSNADVVAAVLELLAPA